MTPLPLLASSDPVSIAALTGVLALVVRIAGKSYVEWKRSAAAKVARAQANSELATANVELDTAHVKCDAIERKGMWADLLELRRQLGDAQREIVEIRKSLDATANEKISLLGEKMKLEFTIREQRDEFESRLTELKDQLEREIGELRAEREVLIHRLKRLEVPRHSPACETCEYYVEANQTPKVQT